MADTERSRGGQGRHEIDDQFDTGGPPARKALSDKKRKDKSAGRLATALIEEMGVNLPKLPRAVIGSLQ